MESWNGYILLTAVGTLIYIVLLNILPEVYNEEEDNNEVDCSSPMSPSRAKKLLQQKESEKSSKGLKFAVLCVGLFTVPSILN